MARNKGTLSNIDNSDLVKYPFGRIKDSTGAGDGTPVNERVYGDIHENLGKLLRLADINFNDIPDNETNGFQYVDALKQLSGKNDLIHNLSGNGTTLSIGLKLNLIDDNEQLICKATNDLTTETTITGLNGNSFSLTAIGNFKVGEYVRLIKTVSGFTSIRLIDSVNLDLAVSELLYLKKASQVEEDAGAIDTKGTTPLTNLTAFIKRVNGVDSSTYLATVLQNGLLSKEDKAIIDGIGASPTRNIGSFSGLDTGDDTIPLGTTYAVSGDVVSATLVGKPNQSSTIRIVLANTMTDTNYYVRSFVQSLSADIGVDNSIGSPVFKPINDTTFDINVEQFFAEDQNLRIHLEVVKI